jgi:putative ABC transport system substrate-binding protein
MTAEPFHQTHIAWIMDFMAKNRLPAVYRLSENVRAGGLMSYGASEPDLFRRAAGYVHKILQGTKPADLPVEQPVKFELAINLKTARALGLTIPESFLLRADEVNRMNRRQFITRDDYLHIELDQLSGQLGISAPGILAPPVLNVKILSFDVAQIPERLAGRRGQGAEPSLRDNRCGRSCGSPAPRRRLATPPRRRPAVASPSTRAAKEVTGVIPIVMVDVGDPVAFGFVPNLARPGGNLTGLSAATWAMGPKGLELLKELVPNAARVGVLQNPTNPGAVAAIRALESAGRTLVMTLDIQSAREPHDFDTVFRALTREHLDGLFVSPDHFLYTQRKQIIQFASENRVPVLYGLREYALAGGLMALGANRSAMFRRAASYVDRILKGAKPADLPVEQPTNFELAVNLRTARVLGITIPPSILLRADEVIE